MSLPTDDNAAAKAAATAARIASMYRPCECLDCAEVFDAEPCLHDYVAPVCPECDSWEVKELRP